MARMQYKTKAEWAAAKAAELEADADQVLRDQRANYNTARDYARSCHATEHLLGEAAKFRRMAEQFRARGV